MYEKIKVLKSLDQEVFVEFYIDGDLPSGFLRFRNSIEHVIKQFEYYSGGKIKYRFIDPLANDNPKIRNKVLYQLSQKGLKPTNIYDREGNQKIEKLVVPGALITYDEQESAVNLLKYSTKSSPEERINEAIENIEYELISHLKNITNEDLHRVGVLQGYSGITGDVIQDLINYLGESFEVVNIPIKELSKIENIDALIVPGIKKRIANADLKKIDQFIVGGGNALFFLNGIDISLDSIQNGKTVGIPSEQNLNNILFNCGVRVNSDLIKDALAPGVLVMNVGNMGEQAQLKPTPWPYYLNLIEFGELAPVKKLDAVYLKFVSTIDTVKAQGIKKSPLIFTSPYTSIKGSPLQVDLNESRELNNPENFKSGKQVVAWYLEGKIKSSFRIADGFEGFKFKSDSTSKIMVCSDADLIYSEFDTKAQQFLPVGYEPVSKKEFGNKEFVKNMLNHMLDEKGIISTKNKTVELRPLDKFKIQNNKGYWQVLNIVVPVLSIILLGLGIHFYRKKKFTS